MRRNVSSRTWLTRLGLATVAGVTTALALASPGAAQSNNPVLPDSGVPESKKCVSVEQARYEHTFSVDQKTHRATATIKMKDGHLCKDQTQAFTLVSYLAPAATFKLPQYLFDSATKSITRRDLAITLEIDVPVCFTQVDFIFGDRVINPLTSNSDLYGDDKVGSDSGRGSRSTPATPDTPKHAWYNGGTEACQTVPEVEVVSNCDGSATLNLRNGKDAVSTTFKVVGDAGYSTEVVVTRSNPVAQVEVGAANAKHLKVTAPGLTKTFEWKQPADCAAPTITTKVDCDSASVTIANPATNAAVEAIIMIAGTTEQKTVTVQPGASQTVELEAGVTVSVTVGGQTAILELKKPASCDAGVSLPVTGANSAIIAGVAILLVAAGAGLFTLSRRRRVTFKA